MSLRVSLTRSDQQTHLVKEELKLGQSCRSWTPPSLESSRRRDFSKSRWQKFSAGSSSNRIRVFERLFLSSTCRRTTWRWRLDSSRSPLLLDGIRISIGCMMDNRWSNIWTGHSSKTTFPVIGWTQTRLIFPDTEVVDDKPNTFATATIACGAPEGASLSTSSSLMSSPMSVAAVYTDVRLRRKIDDDDFCAVEVFSAAVSSWETIPTWNEEL